MEEKSCSDEMLFKVNSEIRKDIVYDVVIIGAGISGITAAKELVNQNINNIRILEACDRVGGRINSYSLQPPGIYSKIEFGANWIHGYDKNPLYNFIKEFDITGFINSDLLVKKLNFDVSKQTYTTQDMTLEFMKEKVNLEAALSKLENYTPSINDLEGEPSLRKLLLLNNWQTDNQSLKKLVEFFYVDCDMAISSDKLSSGILNIKTISPEHYINANNEDCQFFVVDSRGFSSLPYSMLKSFDGEDYLALGTSVVSVEQNKDNVKLLIKDGSTITSKYVLCTVSSGVLNHEDIKFIPELDQNFKDGLKKVEMALYTKIFIKFPYRFWEAKSLILLYDEESELDFQFWQHIHTGLDENVDKTINEPNADNFQILLTTLVGERALEYVDKSSEEILTKVMSVLRKAYGDDIPDPSELYSYNWYNDEKYRGSFPSHLAGITQADISNLKKNQGRLYFTGDWQNENYTGSLHGAYYSSFERTQELISALKLEIKSEQNNSSSALTEEGFSQNFTKSVIETI